MRLLHQTGSNAAFHPVKLNSRQCERRREWRHHPKNFTLDSGHYENMPLNAELLEHFTQFARAVQKHDGTPASPNKLWWSSRKRYAVRVWLNRKFSHSLRPPIIPSYRLCSLPFPPPKTLTSPVYLRQPFTRRCAGGARPCLLHSRYRGFRKRGSQLQPLGTRKRNRHRY